MRLVVPVNLGDLSPSVTSTVMLAGIEHGYDQCQVAFVRVAPKDRWPTIGSSDFERMIFVCRGDLQVSSGGTTAQVGQNDLLRVPANFECDLWNAGPSGLLCLEIKTQGRSGESPNVNVEDLVARFRGHPPVEDSSGFDYQFLANRRSGSAEVAMNVARVLPGHRGPDFHIHKFDQFYFVLAGQLTVEIGFQKIIVNPFSLVKLPAGIVHRQGNAGKTPEEHVAIVCPAPQDGEPLDYQIEMPSPHGEF